MIDRELGSLPEVVLNYRPRCPGCTPLRVIAPGARPCSYYDCPGLPKELQVTCNTCMFDFAAEDGQPKCDHRVCDTALRLKRNVPTYRRWVALITAEAADHGHSVLDPK